MFWITRDTLSFFNQFKFIGLKSMKTKRGVSYSCRLNYGRKKIAMVENNGDGRSTTLQFFEGGEELLHSLDVPKYYKSNVTFKITSEYIVSDLIELYIYYKNIIKKQSRILIYINSHEEIMQIPYRYTFNKIKHSGQLHLIQNKIDDIKSEGGIILNNNLEKLGLKNLD